MQSHATNATWAAIITVAFISVLSLLFEVGVGHLRRSLKRKNQVLEPFLGGVLKELTILGFISFTLFLTIQTGLIQTLNDSIFGLNKTEQTALEEHPDLAPPTTFTEIFEEIHILVFFIMVVFVLVDGLLLISGVGFLKRLTFYENKTETDLMRDASSAMRTNNQVLLRQIDSSLQYYGNKQRLISPLRSFIPRPAKMNFDYSEYISRVFTKLLLKVTEMPFMSLIVATAVAVMLRPLLDITGRAYIIIMCLLALYILLTSLFIKWTVRRLTHQLTPQPYRIRTHLIDKLQNGAPSREDEISALSAPIDQYPLLGPPTFLDSTLANRYERLFWFNRPNGFLTAVQTVLFFHAVAISLYIRSFISFEAEALWFSHGLWAYPLSIGVVLVSLSLWPDILWELGFIISCDVNADTALVKQVEDQIDLKEHKRDIQLLTYLMHRAIYRLGQQGDISADIDIAYRDFEELPDEDKDTLQGVFTVLSESGTIHGGLTLDGLTQAAGVLGLVSDEKNFMLAERFDLVHRNDSGRIDFKEFVYITMLSSRNGWLYKAENSTRLQVIEQVQSLFRYCDRDQDGEVTAEELVQMLEGITPPVTLNEMQTFIHRVSGKASTALDMKHMIHFATKLLVQG